MTTPLATSLLAARYGAEAPATPELSDEFAANFLSHTSVRAFDPDRAVSSETLAAVIAAAQSASTSSNLQSWSCVAIRDPKKLEKLRQIAGGGFQDFIADAPLVLVFLADMSRAAGAAQRAGKSTDGLKDLETFTVATCDAAIATQAALAAAEALDLGGVFLGSLRSNNDQLADLLALPKFVWPVFGLALGFPEKPEPTEDPDDLNTPVIPAKAGISSLRHPAGSAAASQDPLTPNADTPNADTPKPGTGPKPRLRQSAVLFDETYTSDPDQQAADIAEYEARISDYYKKDNHWGSRLADRAAKTTSNQSQTSRLGGDRLHTNARVWLENQGFQVR